MSRTPVSVITGGAGGMGTATARRFVTAGDTVVLVDLDQGRLDVVAGELQGSVVVVAGDITDPACGLSVADAVSSNGTLRAVAHTAGLSPTMGTSEKILDVNLVGTVRLLDALEPLVNDTTAAVLVASQAGHLGVGNDAQLQAVLADPLADGFLQAATDAGITDSAAAYGWSKWAVSRLAIERASAWGRKGGRIVSLSPGIIDTPMGRQELEQQPMMQTIIEMTPLQRMGTSDEIASVIEFLCSSGASFITGTDLLVDGGSTAQLLDAMSEMFSS